MARIDRIPGLTIEGLAIVSADGMIADATGEQPPSLKIPADQQFFFATCAKADVLVHGRNSSEGGPDAVNKRRIILTRRVAGIAPDPDNAKAVLWNPAGAPLRDAWQAHGFSGGLLVVIGGTEGFGLFLELGYDAFHLSRTTKVRLPGGRPVFPGVPTRSPEDLLLEHGLKPGAARVLDPAAELTLTPWTA
jgi:dihydrofolate reductase